MSYVTKKIEDIRVHKVAEATPLMPEEAYNALRDSIHDVGQRVAVIVYRGQIIDGRHRYKALKELGIDTILCDELVGTISEENLKDMVLNVYENRRHQSATQRMIGAYRMYTELQHTDNKISQEEAASRFGVHRNNLGIVKKVHELAGANILELLFQGNDIDIGEGGKRLFTSNIKSIKAYYMNTNKRMTLSAQPSNLTSKFTAEEEENAKDVMNVAEATLAPEIYMEVAKRMFAIAKHRMQEFTELQNRKEGARQALITKGLKNGADVMSPESLAEFDKIRAEERGEK